MCEFSACPCFCYALLCVHSSFAIILKRKIELVALLLLSYRCVVNVNLPWLFLVVPCVGLQFVIVVFPDHTRLLFCMTNVHLSKMLERKIAIVITLINQIKHVFLVFNRTVSF